MGRIRQWRTGGLAALAGTALLAAGLASAAPATGQTTTQARPAALAAHGPVKTMNLAKARAKVLAQHLPANQPKMALLPNGRDQLQNAAGKPIAPKSTTIRPATAVGCITTNCGNLTDPGGNTTIQRHPQYYLLLWGPNWTSDATRTTLENTVTGLGLNDNVGTGTDNWLSALHQYGESDGSPWWYHHGILGADGSGVYNTSYVDTSTPPTNGTAAQVKAEVLAFAAANGVTIGHQQAVVVVPQQGSCEDGTGNCTTLTSCSYHGWAAGTSSSLPYVLEGNPTDLFNKGCTGGSANAVASAAMGHETAETITDPFVNKTGFNGWASQGPPAAEVADLCPGYQSVTLGNGASVTMQSIYSNEAADASGTSGQGCTYDQGPEGPVINYHTAGGSVYCINNGSGTVAANNPITYVACDLSADTGKQMLTNGDGHHLNVQGWCLDNTSNGGSGTLVTLQACSNILQQKFTFVPDPTGHPGYGQYKIGNSMTLCLQRTNTVGAQLVDNTCSATTNNQFWGAPDQYNP